MGTPPLKLIYCADGNPDFAAAAVEAGWLYGARLPSTVYRPVYFADQDWRRPDRARYMAALMAHRPAVASVLDWEREGQLGAERGLLGYLNAWHGEQLVLPDTGGVPVSRIAPPHLFLSTDHLALDHVAHRAGYVALFGPNGHSHFFGGLAGVVVQPKPHSFVQGRELDTGCLEGVSNCVHVSSLRVKGWWWKNGRPR